MQANLALLIAAVSIVVSSATFAQSPQERQQRHPGGAPAQAQPAQPSQPPSAQGQTAPGQPRGRRSGGRRQHANGPDDAGNARAVPNDDAEHAAELHEHDARDDAG